MEEEEEEKEKPSTAGDKRWFLVSDSHVSEVSEDRVLKSQAYLLFYERTLWHLANDCDTTLPKTIKLPTSLFVSLLLDYQNFILYRSDG